MRRLSDAEGVWQDYLGALLNAPRPLVSSGEDAAGPRFGFGNAGQGFGNRFLSGNPVLSDRSSLGDDCYGRILRARGLALLGSPTIPHIYRCASAVDPQVQVIDNHDLSYTIVTQLSVMEMQLAANAGALPKPAGVFRDIGAVLPPENVGVAARVLTWEPPLDAGTQVTGYEAQADDGDWVQAGDTDARRHVFAAGASFRVRATTSRGPGARSRSIS